MGVRKVSVKIVKWVIGIIAAIMLFGVIKDYVMDIYNDYQHEYTNTEITQGKDVVVEIPEGATEKDIAKILKRKGLIKYKTAFTRRLSNSEYSGKLKSGVYTLNTGMNTLEMMRIMSEEKEVEGPIAKLVVPEGFTIDQIAERCEEQGICSKSDFIKAVKSITSTDFGYLAEVPSGADVRYRLEGFLFPATYDIYKDTTPDILVREMLRAFKNNYSEKLQEMAEERGLTTYEVITLASILERECRVPEERKMMARVYYNRLDAEMPLQVDPTVLYPLTEGLYNKEVVTYDDLELDSPYNTYLYAGLPAGPISNPGNACIYAVLNPDDNDYYYYRLVNEEKGYHKFSETLEEHEDTSDDERWMNGIPKDDEETDGDGDGESDDDDDDDDDNDDDW